MNPKEKGRGIIIPIINEEDIKILSLGRTRGTLSFSVQQGKIVIRQVRKVKKISISKRGRFLTLLFLLSNPAILVAVFIVR